MINRQLKYAIFHSTTQRQQMLVLTVLCNSTQDRPLNVTLSSALHTGESLERKMSVRKRLFHIIARI